MDENELRERTKAFVLRIIKLVEALPEARTGRPLATSSYDVEPRWGPNYRAACRARSKPDFISKIGIVEEEADESAYWLELIRDHSLMKKSLIEPLLQEAEELRKIFTASRLTAKQKLNQKSSIKNQQ